MTQRDEYLEGITSRDTPVWAREFPTTLCDLFPDSILFHVYTEYRGLRYYVASETTWANANSRACEYRIAYPKAMTFVRDRADSTQIDGAWQELRTAYHGANR